MKGMESMWESVKKEIKNCVPDHCFRMWLEPVKFLRSEKNYFVLSCPNSYSKKRVIDQYGSLIESEINKISDKTYKLVIEESIEKSGRDGECRENLDDDFQMTLPDTNIYPKNSGRFLRKDFTFDQFVVGDSNDFAYSAALSLASQKSFRQNSLFLLSNTGMGKSHLAQAVGHHVLSNSPADRVYYITAEDFTNEMVSSLKNGSIDQFKEKYRKKCDVLLLEDVHFLSGKERTQVELSLTLDTLFDSGKKLIFSSCYLPTKIPKLNDKLRSRLSSGIISSIEPPNFKTRIKILDKKSKANGYSLPEDVNMYLAGELTENVRQLESGLTGVMVKSSLLGLKIDRNLAESVVKNIIQQQKSITIDVIKKLVCKYYNISIADIVSRSRKHNIVKPRQIAIYLARRYTDQSLQAIGRSFNRYHATALHAISSVERKLKENGSTQKQVELFCQKLEEGKF